MTITVRIVDQAKVNLAGIQASLAALGLQVTKTSDSVNKFSFDALANSAQRFSDVMNRVGNRLTTTFTLPILAAFDVLGKAALAQETATTQLENKYTSLGSSAAQITQQLGQLDKVFTLLSDKFGIAKVDVINIATAWAQAGAAGVGLAKDVQTSLEVMTLGLASAADASKDLIAIQSLYGESNDQLNKTVADLVITTKNAPVTFQDLATGIINAGGAARTAGVDVDHLAALIATMVPATGNAADAGNSLRTILTRLLVPTKDSVSILGQMGINMQGLAWQTQDGAQKMETLAQAFVKLTPAQQGVVSQVVASRFQISRFDQAMRDIADPAGKYAQILGAVSDKQKVMTEYSKELTNVLSSDPQALKEIWNTLKNALTEVLIPMLPALIGAAHEIAGLATSFSNLSPEVQKLIIYGLLLLAALGPIAKYAAAMSGLFSIMTKGFIWLLGLGEGAAFKPLAWLWQLIKMPFDAIVSGFSSLFGAIVGGAQAADIALESTTVALAAMGPEAASVAAVDGAEIGGGLLAGIASAFGPDEIALIVAAIAAALAAIAYVIYANWNNVKKWIADFGTWLVGTMAAAWNLLPDVVQTAMADVIQVLANAAEQVVHFLSYLNPFAKHSPSLVENVQNGLGLVGDHYTGVVDGPLTTAQNAHSQFVQAASAPSVAAAVAPAAATFNTASDTIDTTNMSVKQLKDNTAALKSQMDLLKSSLDSVTSSLDTQNGILKGLQATAAVTQEQLATATTRLNDLKNTQISGSKAMSDSIFNNTQAQKALNLQIDQLSDVGGVYVDVAAKAATLRGEIEQTTATQASLRARGAGSDVLAPYSSQLDDLKKQQAGLVNIGSQYTDLNNQLTALQHAGDELNLQQSLQFDPLNRQIQDVTSNLKEMPFPELLAQTTAAQDQVNSLTLAYDAQNDAVKTQQQVVDALQQTHDTLASTYANEKSQLDQLNSALATATTAKGAQPTQAVKDFGAGALANFADPGANFKVPANNAGDISAYIKGLNDQIGKGFKSIDMFKPFKDLFNSGIEGYKSFAGAIGKTTVDLFVSGWKADAKLLNDLGHFTVNLLVSGFKADVAILDRIGRDTANLFTAGFKAGAAALNAISRESSESFNAVLGVLKTVGATTATIFRDIGAVVTTAIRGVVMPVLSALWTFLNGYVLPVLQLLYGIAEVTFFGIRDVIRLAWAGAKVTFGDMVVVIRDVVVPVFMWFWNTVVAPIFNALVGLITNVVAPTIMWLWHNVVQTAFVGIQTTITTAWQVIGNILQTLWNFITTVVAPVFTWLWHTIVEPAVRGISSVLSLKWIDMKAVLQDMHDFFTNTVAPIFDWLWHTIIEKAFNGIASTLSTVWGTIKSDAATAINFLINAFNTVADIIKSVGSAVGVKITIDHMNPIKAASGAVLSPQMSAAGDIYHGIPSNNVGSGFKTSHPRAIVGEGNSMHDEYVIPTDPQHRGRALGLAHSLMGQLGVPGFANGGVLGGIGNAIGGIVNSIPGIGDLAGTIGDWLAKGADAGINLAKSAADSVIDSVVPLPMLKDIGKGTVNKTFDGLKALVSNALAAQGAVGVGGTLGSLSDPTSLLALARRWIGTPYKWGGGHAGPVPIGTPVDCSGLVDQVYGVGGNTTTQDRLGVGVNGLGAALPADLVFFGPRGAPGETHHVGIYVGNGQMIDAPHTGAFVRQEPVFGDLSIIRRLVNSQVVSPVPIPGVGVPVGSGASANAALGMSMAAAMGWSGPEWNALSAVATRESGWNQFARNKSSGAYGIPQALPESKLPFLGQAAGGSDPGSQIGWMVNYIKSRYGDPINAWAHEQSAGWYAGGGLLMDSGGMLPPGWNAVYNGLGKPEPLVNADKQKGGAIHFHGDLSFPNVKNGDDAAAFVKNLARLAK